MGNNPRRSAGLATIRANRAATGGGGGRDDQPPAGPQPPHPYSVATNPDEVTDEQLRAYHAADRAWQQQMGRAISLGTITPQEAEARGFHLKSGQRTDAWQPLPHDLYHVTVAADAVRSGGLTTRAERGGGLGTGLGGGDDQTISFTTDRTIDRGIRDGLLEMRSVARGDLTVDDLLAQARAGTGAPHPFEATVERFAAGILGQQGIEHLRQGIVERAGSLGEAPRNDGEGWQPVARTSWVGGDGKTYASYWQRPMTPAEHLHDTVQFYKTFAAAREDAGGQYNPVFFSNDYERLARTPASQIQILHYHPRAGAMGFHQSAAEAEWRTMAGNAVQLATD